MAQSFQVGIYGVPNIEMFHRPVEGAVQYCEEQALRIRDFRLDQLLDMTEASPPPWRGRVDGILLGLGVADVTPRQVADWILSGGVPAVSVSADWFDPRVPSVVMNRKSLARLAVMHLLDGGCKSFVYFGYEHSAGSRARASEFSACIVSKGHKVSDIQSPNLYVGAYNDADKLPSETRLLSKLRSLRKPVGIWALNDNYARLVCLACERLNLAVPEQVKVLGVDDLTIARLGHPAISSIRTPGKAIGYRAVSILHRMMLGKTVKGTIEVDAEELIARDSTSAIESGSNDLQDIIQYIARHACEGIHVDQIAHMVGSTRRALEKRFHQHLGRSPGEEIRRVRLERAKALLSQTDLSISRIGSMVGYEETAAFSKFFRKEMGKSPREFRAEVEQALSRQR